MSRASLGVNPVTGTLAATEGADTAAFIGLTAVFGTLAAAEGADRGGEHLPSHPQPKRRHRQRTLRPPDGLHTASEAAAKLGCSIKTLSGHVAAGALKYVSIGHGTKRPRKMFTDADLDQFIAAQTRKDQPCPSAAIRGRRTGSTIFKSEVIAFTARPKSRPGGKRKR